MAGLDREATSTAERAVAARPTPFALYSLGIALRETGSGGRAAEALARSVRMAPRYRAAGLALADLLWRRGRMSAALDVYARIAEGDDALPEPAAARLRLARELGRAFLDRMAEAVKDSGT
jgi:tetratricopeptide (TPR) repeat protein